MSRELRSLVPFEVAAVVAIAVVPLVVAVPETLPAALPLVVAATASRWIRGRGWGELTAPSGVGSLARAGLGTGAGLVALALAVVVGARETTSLAPIPIGGDVTMGAIALVHVAVTAVAAELALRGWIVERVLELSPGSPVLPVCVGALAEALVTPGDAATRIGAAVFGVGLGWMFVLGGRNVIAPMLARVAFFVGAVAIEALQLV